MRISDGSSDVCSSDRDADAAAEHAGGGAHVPGERRERGVVRLEPDVRDRKGVGWGKRVSVSVDLGVRHILKKIMKLKTHLPLHTSLSLHPSTLNLFYLIYISLLRYTLAPIS